MPKECNLQAVQDVPFAPCKISLSPDGRRIPKNAEILGFCVSGRGAGSGTFLAEKKRTPVLAWGEIIKTKPSMSKLVAKGNWNIAKGKLKQRFARWIRNDQAFYDGKVDELMGRIQKRAGAFKHERPVAVANDNRHRHP